MKKEESFESIRIMTIDGSKIYREMNRMDGKNGLSFNNDRGNIDPDRFNGLIDSSLDTEKLSRVYSEHEECDGKFLINGNCTKAIINVTFDYSVKHYYVRNYYDKGKIQRQLYIKDGYNVDFDDLIDHVCVIEESGDKTLVAIEVANKNECSAEGYIHVENPIPNELLDDYFTYDSVTHRYLLKEKKKADGKKSVEDPVTTKTNIYKIRKWLYKNGFDVDGIHYVRYKRSAGSSREGHCLFIAEPLYKDMMEWSSCGLDAQTVTDQTSFQAYVSLSLSSIEKKIYIPKQSILLIRDQSSTFTDKVIRVVENGSNLDAACEETRIENIVWDGEALLDKSVFDEFGYSEKGMMLLRNRFFKTCAFNTNLQEWFKDNGITKPSQLNGYYSKTVRSIDDIKLVITESSLKYLKFRPEDVSLEEWFQKWIDNIYINKEESLFGVVKTDKPSGPMNNHMVWTNYQLLNTLALSQNDVDMLLKPSLDYLHKIQTDPMYLRYYSSLWVSDEFDEEVDDIVSNNYRQRLIIDIMRRTDRFERTKFYSDYRTDLCKSFKKKLKLGRILVNGGYHTLFGNGLEFLHAVIDKEYKVDKPLALADGEIYTKRFEDNEQLLCARSPHITMGNVFVAKNKYVAEYDKYFNLGVSRTIVCVNSIGSNIMQRLNGCDYDSDAMLITNNSILSSAAALHYNDFPVPVCDVKPSGKVKYTSSPDSLAELDVKLYENKIGEVVNLSQFLNSLYWDKLHNGADQDELDQLYLDICKLAVLSGMEIDKAKRIYSVSADIVLDDLRKYKEKYKKEHEDEIPKFFEFITEAKKGKQTKEQSDRTQTPGKDIKPKVSSDAKLYTAMSHIFDAVNFDNSKAPKKTRIPYIDLFEIGEKVKDENGTYAKRCKSIMEFFRDTQKEMKSINFMAKNNGRSEKALLKEKANMLLSSCMDKIEKTVDDPTLVYLLEKLDCEVSEFHALMLASMCYANNGYLMKKLKSPENEMYDLIAVETIPQDTDSSNIVMLFGYPHVIGRRHNH